LDIATRTAITETIINGVKEIALSKGKAYSGEEDVLANFKRGEDMTGVTKYQVWAIYAMKHIDTIMNAIKFDPSRPIDKTEGMHGRILDTITYLTLLECMLFEDKLLDSSLGLNKINEIMELSDNYRKKMSLQNEQQKKS